MTASGWAASSCMEKEHDAEQYEASTDIVKRQGFDFVDGWYYGNIEENAYFSTTPSGW